jgi:hypothetical protein
MIDLNDDNDPLLFACQIPEGRLVLQYMEVVATVQTIAPDAKNPDMPTVVEAIRRAARSQEVAKAASSVSLIAAWHRINAQVESAGKV